MHQPEDEESLSTPFPLLHKQKDDPFESAEQRHQRRIVIAILISIVLFGAILLFIVTLTGSDSSRQSFLWVTDPHIDPFYSENVSCSLFCRSVPVALMETECGPYAPSGETFTAPFGRHGCDSPKSLFESSLKAMTKVDPSPAMVLVTGDLPAHDLCGSSSLLVPCRSISDDPSATMTVLEYACDKFSDSFPESPVLNTLGNNDVPVHYVTPLHGSSNSWLARVEALFKPLALCSNCSSSKVTDSDFSLFQIGGFYRVRVGDMETVVLNTLLFGDMSRRNLTGTGTLQEHDAVAKQQLGWLQSVLRKAVDEGRMVLIAGHTPPAMQPFDNVAQWVEPYVSNFTQQLKLYGNRVGGLMFGHYHYDTYQILGLSDSDEWSGPLNPSRSSHRLPSDRLKNPPPPKLPSSSHSLASMVGPGVSPMFFNNPGFRRCWLSSGVVVDYDQYFLDLLGTNMDLLLGKPKDGGYLHLFPLTLADRDDVFEDGWRLEYSFTSTYGLSSDGRGLSGFFRLMLEDTRTFAEYQTHRVVSYTPHRMHFYCAMLYDAKSDFDNCWKQWDEYDKFDACFPRK